MSPTEAYVNMPDHKCKWGPVEHSQFTGNPYRTCSECGEITLDLEDKEEPTYTAAAIRKRQSKKILTKFRRRKTVA